jgi:queuine tRNA-ribosyltransferase
MSFDECIPYPSDKSMPKFLDRADPCAGPKRGLGPYPRRPSLFGIVQGGAYRDFREYAAKELAKMDFPGYSIGGTSIGEPKEVCLQMVEDAVRYLPPDKPRYLDGRRLLGLHPWAALSAALICSTAFCRLGSPGMAL